MLIYFDLDGPIIDVSGKFYKIYSDLLGERGYPTLSKKEYWQLKREHVPIPQIVLRTCPNEFVDYYIKKRIEVIENFEYLKHDELIPGAEKVLEELMQDHKLILVTLRNNSKTLFQELVFFDLKRYFTTILSLDNNHGDWRIKVKLIEDSGSLTDKNSLIVGDTEADIITGKKLGIKTCAVMCGIRTKELLEKASPDYLIKDINSLGEVIKKIQS
jgi:phosphoglycolate phosphatase